MRTKSVIHQSQRCCQFDNADDDEHDLRSKQLTPYVFWVTQVKLIEKTGVFHFVTSHGSGMGKRRKGKK